MFKYDSFAAISKIVKKCNFVLNLGKSLNWVLKILSHKLLINGVFDQTKSIEYLKMCQRPRTITRLLFVEWGDREYYFVKFLVLTYSNMSGKKNCISFSNLNVIVVFRIWFFCRDEFENFTNVLIPGRIEV